MDITSEAHIAALCTRCKFAEMGLLLMGRSVMTGTWKTGTDALQFVWPRGQPPFPAQPIFHIQY
eukprot:824672-Rhodomonas_salina.4